MKITSVSQINFGKLYIPDSDYSPEQNILINKISEGLNDRFYGSDNKTYIDELEDCGWDLVIKKNADKNKIGLDFIYRKGLFGEEYKPNGKDNGLPPVFLYKLSDKYDNDTDFDPNKILKWAKNSSDLTHPLKLGVYIIAAATAAILLLLAVSGVSSGKAKDKAKAIIEKTSDNIKTALNNNSKTFKLNA